MASKPWFDAGRGVWWMKYRPDPIGPWERVNLGKHPTGWSKARPPSKPPQLVVDRHAEFAEIEYRARNGLEPAKARARSLEGYLRAYVESYGPSHKPGSLKQVKRYAERFLAFCDARGVTSLQAVTPPVCRDYQELRLTELGPSTVRTERGYLIKIWTRALEDGLMTSNPWSLAKAPGVASRPIPTFWSAEEVLMIAAACVRPWQGELVLVLATTGLRISAALAMEWGWVDFRRGRIAVPAEHSKSGRAFEIAMTADARQLLERRAFEGTGSSLVFPNPYADHGIVPYDSAREAIARAIRRAGVRAGTPHDLRHTYGRALAAAGVPINIIQSQLSHASLSSTQIYTQVGTDEATKRVTGFSFGLGGEARKTPPTSASGPSP
jgi:integrase/recombinase XerD